ncbi:methylated-DNA--[protein]-cysteine S-methyltransferase [Nocardia miyunensis]|uniref:methylated-DNA--[protein]-cysteine S-methyltransferase n=1 Tax=Nocardia miyunensis TaxID=282684 RepID=UPI00082FAB0F|nr:MGMT family protein [Nocardia miyunensis]
MPDSDRSPSAALFDTAIGVCALVWTDVGVLRFLLPEATADLTRTRMLRGGVRETEPDATAAEAIAAARAHLDGDLDDLRWIRLDHTGLPDFHRAVYGVTRAIDPGHTLTYGQVAERIGAPGAAQAVGQALGQNEIPLIIPCHRVLAADHALHGFSAPGGITTKAHLLEIERTPGFGEPTLF